MTTSPYDNLPSGNYDIMPGTDTHDTQEDAKPKYVDVEVSPPPAPAVETAPHSKPVKTIPLTPPPQYTNISIKNLQARSEYILPFEETLLVPDTMPDMQKVLFAEGRVDLSHQGKTSYDANDFLTGNITAYTIYRPVSSSHSPAAGPAAYNECPVDVVKSIVPFKTDKCWGNVQGDSFRPDVNILEISAEMINERKFTIRGKVMIKISCIADRELKIFKGSADSELIARNDSVHATVLDHETSDTTEISQEITIKEDQPAPVKILKFSTEVVENHRQITSGKLVINASIHLSALYLGETANGERKLSCINNKTDFTQFIVMDDKTDPDLIHISFSSGGLELVIENKDKFKLNGTVTTLIRSFCDRDIDIVSDAYHKKRNLHFDTLSDKICCVKDAVSGEISSREIVTLSDADKKPSVLLSGSCRISSMKSRIEKDRLIIEGTMPVKILTLDEDNKPFVISHTVPVRGSLAHTANITDSTALSAYIDASIKEFWFGEVNSHQLEINTVLTLSVWLFAEETFCTIDGLCFAEDDEHNVKSRMAIYVVDNKDTLWDIAKRYKIDIDALASLNELDPAKQLPAGAKLFISK